MKKYVTLGEVCKLNMGQSPDSSTYNDNGEGVPFYQGNADFGDIHPITAHWCTSPTKIAEDGDILISVRAPIGALNIATERCCIGRGLAAITVDSKVVSRDYIWYMLKSRVATLQAMGTGSTFKAINKNVLNDMQFILPTLEEQREIALNLSKIDTVIRICTDLMNKLDVLVKSRFVEMFGDPVTNPLKWNVKPVIDECECMVPGRDKPKSFTGDIPWITIEDLIVNGITEKSKSGLGLTIDEIKEVNRKVIPVGSVIMSCVGNLGICSIAGQEMIINQQLHSFQCKEKINNVYLMFNLTYRKDYMNKWASNTTVLYMNKSICNSIPIMLPPLALQEQFAAFVEKTDKSKLAVKQVLEKAETLKKALMQEYFG